MNLPSYIALLGIGPTEFFVLLAIFLLFFGAKWLPNFARGLGKTSGEIKKAREDFQKEQPPGDKP